MGGTEKYKGPPSLVHQRDRRTVALSLCPPQPKRCVLPLVKLTLLLSLSCCVLCQEAFDVGKIICLLNCERQRASISFRHRCGGATKSMPASVSSFAHRPTPEPLSSCASRSPRPLGAHISSVMRYFK